MGTYYNSSQQINYIFFQYMYRASFIILCHDAQTHSYFTDYQNITYRASPTVAATLTMYIEGHHTH
jgi:superoxide dismutase